MSELHLQFIRERLKRRDKVEVDAKEPKIPYRETVQAHGRGKLSAQEADRRPRPVRRSPHPAVPVAHRRQSRAITPPSSAFRRCANSITTRPAISCGSIRSSAASIPNNFLPAVEKGFKERLERGVIAGYRIQDVCAEVYFGKHHPVDSSEAAFKTAGSMAFRNVFQQAKPGLLEPIVTLHVTVPGTQAGRHQQRPVGPPRPRAGHGFGRRRFANRHRRGAPGRGDHLCPGAVEHDRRARQLHDGIRPLRPGAAATSRRRSSTRISTRKRRRNKGLPFPRRGGADFVQLPAFRQPNDTIRCLDFAGGES